MGYIPTPPPSLYYDDKPEASPRRLWVYYAAYWTLFDGACVVYVLWRLLTAPR